MPNRELHFTAFIAPAGYHESAWRVVPEDPRSALTLPYYAQLARIAESGALDALFCADNISIAEYRVEHLPQALFDPLELLCALAALTERIGLIATGSTTYTAPWELARRFATLDFLSGGRAGWNIVTTSSVLTAANYGRDEHPAHDERYAAAVEFVEVVRRVWDAWEDGAVVGSKQIGDLGRPREGARTAFSWRALRRRRHPAVPALAAGPPRARAGGFVRGRHGSRRALRRAGLHASADDRRGDRVPRVPARPGGGARALARPPPRAPGADVHAGIDGGRGRALARRSSKSSQAPSSAGATCSGWSGSTPRAFDPDAPLPDELLAAPAPTSGAERLFATARRERVALRELGRIHGGMPTNLTFGGTPEQLAQFIAQWSDAGAVDGFTLMPTTLPDGLAGFVDHVLPILRREGRHRSEYAGTTLREHLGLPRPPGRGG